MRLNFERLGIVLMALLLVLGTSGLVAAGEEGESDTTSLTGCLSVTDEGGYVLDDQESDETVVLDGEGLGDHVGHTVTVTGDWAEDDEGMKYFAVDSLEHLSSSCEA